MTNVELGSRISSYRKNKNMTQEELANRIGITPQALSKWERNQSLPDISLLISLCNILEVSADCLLGTDAQKITEGTDKGTEDKILRQLRNCLPPLELIFSVSLVPSLSNNFVKDIEDVRTRLAKEGILMPLVWVRDEGVLKENEFMILAYRNVLYDEVLCGSKEENYEKMIACLEKTVRDRYADLLNKDIVKKLVDNLAISYPALVENTVPDKISYGFLLDILKKFIALGKPICYLPKIIEKAESLLHDNPALSAETIALKIAGELETAIRI
ncbi:MAG: helix-turn-helix domain-containing protein [Lachnospiraceae bacterium]|nr:helix-turn-helix domain-containing protein [Lachnospiraceae bacterium]